MLYEQKWARYHSLISNFCFVCEFKNPQKLIRKTQIQKKYKSESTVKFLEKEYDMLVAANKKIRVRKISLTKDGLGWYNICDVCKDKNTKSNADAANSL